MKPTPRNIRRSKNYAALINGGVSSKLASQMKDLSTEKIEKIIKITKLRDIDYYDNIKNITGRDYQ